MRRFLVRIGRRRIQLTIGGLMLAVAVISALVNWLRPITPFEAARIAEAHFRTVPGASRWIGRYKVYALPAESMADGDIWWVVFTKYEDGGLLARITVTSRGELRAMHSDLRGISSGALSGQPGH